jgi:hypothetical protein
VRDIQPISYADVNGSVDLVFKERSFSVSKLCLTLVAVAVVSLSVGCSVPRAPISGSLYVDVKDNLQVNPGPLGPNKGEATASSIIGITTGDCSVTTAAANGKITEISHVDYHSWGIMGIFAKTTTVVYGK